MHAAARRIQHKVRGSWASQGISSENPAGRLKIGRRMKSCPTNGYYCSVCSYGRHVMHEPAAAALEAGAQDLLAAIVESSDAAIMSKDLNGLVTSWNKGAERMFGYTAEEMIGQSISKLTPPGRADEMPGILERIKRGEHVDSYETVRFSKTGQVVDRAGAGEER